MMEKLGRSPQQHRSRITTNRFLTAALKLLKKQTYAELSVIELAKNANRSVGTFYQRFGGKDEFLKILIANFLDSNIDDDVKKWRGKTPKAIFTIYLEDTYNQIRKNRNLWHAALERSSMQPDFWSNFAELRSRRWRLALDAMSESRGRKLTPAQIRRLSVAIQVYNSVINNQVINGPGPLSLDDKEFLQTMSAIAHDIARIGN